MMWVFLDAALNNRRALILVFLTFYFISRKVPPDMISSSIPLFALTSASLASYALLSLKKEGVLEHILAMSPKDNWRTLLEIVISYSVIAVMIGAPLFNGRDLLTFTEFAVDTLAVSPALMVIVMLLPETLARVAPIAIALIVLSVGKVSLYTTVVGLFLSALSLLALRVGKLQEIVLRGWER